MNDERLRELAQEAVRSCGRLDAKAPDVVECILTALRTAVAEAVAKEREACKLIAEEAAAASDDAYKPLLAVAAAIRSRQEGT